VASKSLNEMVHFPSCAQGTEAYGISKGNFQRLLSRPGGEKITNAINLSLSVLFFVFFLSLIAGGCKGGLDRAKWC